MTKNSKLWAFLKDGKNRETTTQEMTMSFNEPDPESCATTLHVKVNLTGPEYHNWFGIAKEARNEAFGDEAFYQKDDCSDSDNYEN